MPSADDLRPAIAAGVRRRRVRRRATWSAAGAFAMVALLALVPNLLSNRTVQQQTLFGELGVQSGTDQSRDARSARPLHVLLLGIDRRPEDGASNDGAPQDGAPELNRSDAILLIHVDRARRTAYQISIPRDLAVDLPDQGQHRANAAYALGGYDLATRMVTGLTGVTVETGAVIDFSGVQRIIDAIGGVEFCVDQRTVSSHVGFDRQGNHHAPIDQDGERFPGITPYVYEVGCQRLVGWQALDYVRQRRSLPQGAQDRDRHLRQLLAAVAEELTDPVKAAKALPVVGSAVELHLGKVALTDLAGQLGGVDRQHLVGVRVPTSQPQKPGTALSLHPDSAGLFAALRDDTMAEWIAANPTYRS